MDVMDDDDSENDSDYLPEEELNRKKGGQEEDEEVNVGKSALPEISVRRKRKAQELWEEIQKDDADYLQFSLGKALRCDLSMLEIPLMKEKRKMRVFIRKLEKRPTHKLQLKEDNSSSEAIKKEALEIVSQIKKKTKVEEKKKFAGKEIMSVFFKFNFLFTFLT
jgi:hypothetical protein